MVAGIPIMPVRKAFRELTEENVSSFYICLLSSAINAYSEDSGLIVALIISYSNFWGK